MTASVTPQPNLAIHLHLLNQSVILLQILWRKHDVLFHLRIRAHIGILLSPCIVVFKLA